MVEYALPVIKLIGMLLRNNQQKILLFDLPEKLMEDLHKIEDLHKAEDLHKFEENIEQLSMLIFEALVGMWTHTWAKSRDIQFPDPTVVSIALSMLQKDGSFADAKYTTGVFSKVQYDMRMVFGGDVYSKAYPCNTDEEFLKQGKLLEPWYTEGNDSTFNTIRSLQHRASAIVYAQHSLPSVWWLNRDSFETMLYEGHQINFGDVCKIFVELEDLVIQLWEEKIILGLDLQVGYGLIADDLTNSQVGYSFISDPRNPFQKNKDQLMDTILKHSNLRKQFILGTDSTSGQQIWNKPALKSWLHNYSLFHGMLLLRANMLGGSPGRVTELTAMCYRNISTSTSRSVLALGKHVAMMVTYHKGSALTGVDKLIPHAFDAITSDLIIQDLAIARPFAELAAHICFPEDDEIYKIYRDHLFINNKNLFNTDQVTHLMKKYSLSATGYGIGVLPWRHISAAWRRKFCSRFEALIDDEDNETVQALQSGHSRRTENFKYGVSTDFLAGASEDVLPLFLEASTDWQVECRTVPGGLGLKYSDARSSQFHDLVRNGVIKTSKSHHKEGMDLTEATVDLVIGKLRPIITSEVEMNIQKVIEEIRPVLSDIVTNSIRTIMGMIFPMLDFSDHVH